MTRQLRFLAYPALAASLLLGLACGDDGGSDTSADTNSMTSGETETATTMTGTTMTGTTMTGTTMTGTTMTTDPDTGTAGPVCPPDGDEDECSLCILESCCEALTACQSNPDCDCVVTCIAASDLPLDEAIPECQTECEVEALPTEAIGLQACQASMCMVECA